MKFKNIRFLAALLAIILMVASWPIAVFSVESAPLQESGASAAATVSEFGVIPKEETEDKTVLCEITSRREKNVKHFDIGNGMVQAVTYGTAIHRKDASGTWQDIDNRLLPDSKGGLYATPDGRTTVAAAVSGDLPLLSLEENGFVISMTPVISTFTTASSAKIENHKVKRADSIQGASITEAAKIENSSSVKYENVFAATDLEYVLTANDVKENIIVKSPQSSYRYTFRLTLGNLYPVLRPTGEIVLLSEETREEAYYIPAPFMYDASGEVSHRVHYELEEGEDAYLLTVVADPAWVNAEERNFPVTIDPTVKVTDTYDTYISSYNPNTNYGTSTEIWISSGEIAFIYCPMPYLPAGCSFYAAKLYVHYYYHNSVVEGSLLAGAYQVMHSWNETGTNGLTWNIAQPSTTSYISSTRLSAATMWGTRNAYINSPQRASFTVTGAASAWYADMSSNHGIAIKYESGTNSSVILKSYETGSAYQAYFVITYLEPQILNGIYRIKNAATGKYLDITDGGVTPGTEVQQYTPAAAGFERNQLFKITFVRTADSSTKLNYYTIRPMTNNGLGLESSISGTDRGVTIEEMSTSDAWADLLYNHLWSIAKSGTGTNTYTIKNGGTTDASYLTAPSAENGAQVVTANTVTNYSKWILEPYTGAELYGAYFLSFDSSLLIGEEFTYRGYMYDTDIGVNGPLQFSVTNTDGTPTDAATIHSYLGRLTALRPGQISVRMTYEGAAWIWYGNVTITMEGAGCKGYYIITLGSDETTDVNCQGYAFFTRDDPQEWHPTAQRDAILQEAETSNEILYGVDNIPGYKALLEDNWLDSVFPGKWEEVYSSNGGLDIELGEGEWLVVFRIGRISKYKMDYHFWYRTNTGEWANKHGSGGSIHEFLGDDLPTDDDSPGWVWNFPNRHYDSDIIYYVITDTEDLP